MGLAIELDDLYERLEYGFKGVKQLPADFVMIHPNNASGAIILELWRRLQDDD